MRILLVAAEAMELRGIVRRASGVRPAPLAVDWARTASLGGHAVLLAAHGAGWKRAAAATAQAIDHFAPDAVVSTGFCGALEENMNVADVVVGTGIRRLRPSAATADPASGETACSELRAAAPHHQGVICSIDHIARTADEKRRLRAAGGCAVEMEAAGVAECASASHLPFFCVRAVTDLAGENLTNDFNTSLRSDGHFDTMLIFRGAVRHPGARIPELARLGFRCARASRSLGEFLASCQF